MQKRYPRNDPLIVAVKLYLNPLYTWTEQTEQGRYDALVYYLQITKQIDSLMASVSLSHQYPNPERALFYDALERSWSFYRRKLVRGQWRG